MDIVLGVSMTPPSVRMVLVEGDNAGGVTVDEDGFEVDAAGVEFSDQVVSAILGTQESAQQGGYRLASTGVTVANQLEATRLRDILAGRRVENVMLVSAFLAAAALAQAVGGAIGYERTALMFIEPDGATLAVVDSSDGSITEVQRVALPSDDTASIGTLTSLAAQAGRLSSRPDGLFVVGSGVNVGLVKPELDAASLIPVSVPEEPETALARGAALASAHAPLFDSSTSAMAWARDPGTGVIDPELVALSYAYQAGGANDYDATMNEYALAYSAVPDDADGDYLAFADEDSADDYAPSSGVRVLDDVEPARRRRPFLLAGSGLAAFFVAGVSTLLVVLAVGSRPTAAEHPAPSQHIVVPTQQAPPPAPAPEVAPVPVPPAPAPAAPAPAAPAPPVVKAPAAPVPAAPAPAAPAPEAPAPLPIPVPIPLPIQVPAPVDIPASVAPAPAAPVPAPPEKQPELPPIFRPPTQNPPKKDNPSWLPGNNGGGNKGGNPSWLPGDNGGGNKGGNPSWLPGDNGGGGHKGDAPSPWLPGVGTNGGGGNPWLPGLGGRGHSGGGGGSWFPRLGGGGGHGGGGHGGGWGGGHGRGFHF